LAGVPEGAPMEDDSITTKDTPGQFSTTRWSVVRAAAGSEEERVAAMTRLFQSYWQPLYLFLRREGRTREEAEDLLQELFVRLLDGRLLNAANPERGRFRSLLLSSLRNLQVDLYRAGRTQKRGSGAEQVSLDVAMAESHWKEMADTGLSPEMAYDRAWAQTLLQRAGRQLSEAFAAEGKQSLFAELFPHVTGSQTPGGFAAAAERLDMNEKAARVALSRMRRRYAAAIRAEVACTVGSEEEEKDELRYLLDNFS
jgi:RNA polymerase sigma factor (sigma-70 family)